MKQTVFVIALWAIVCLFVVAPVHATVSFYYLNDVVGNASHYWTSEGNTNDSVWQMGDGQEGSRYLSGGTAEATWFNPDGIYYSKYKVLTGYGGTVNFNCNGETHSIEPHTWQTFTTGGAGAITCYQYTSNPQVPNGQVFIYEIMLENGTPPAPVADFTASPLSGVAPLTVQFTDLSTGNPTAWSWSASPAGVYWVDPAARNASAIFNQPGNYTVNLTASNTGGSNTASKVNYIWAINTSTLVTTYCTARDIYTGFAIHGAGVDMKDVENGSWTNSTPADGTGSIQTLSSHHLDLWGHASGYSWDDLLSVPATNGGYYSLLLTPTGLNVFNVSAGNLTLFVTVEDSALPHNTVEGSEVSVAWGSSYLSGTTNGAGTVSFTVPNNTALYLSAFKSGYTSGSLSHVTGTGNGGSTKENVIVYLGQTVVTTATPEPTGSNGQPITQVQTIDPYPCLGTGTDEDNANCRMKQGAMASDVIAYGPILINLFILATIIGVAKMMGK